MNFAKGGKSRDDAIGADTTSLSRAPMAGTAPLSAGKREVTPTVVGTVLAGSLGAAVLAIGAYGFGSGAFTDLVHAASNKPSEEITIDDGGVQPDPDGTGQNAPTPSTTSPERPGAPGSEADGSVSGVEDGPAAGGSDNLDINIDDQSFTGNTYYIERGDTLAKISAATGVSVDRLVAANDIVNPNLIYAGSALEIPPRGMYRE